MSWARWFDCCQRGLRGGAYYSYGLPATGIAAAKKPGDARDDDINWRR